MTENQCLENQVKEGDLFQHLKTGFWKIAAMTLSSDFTLGCHAPQQAFNMRKRTQTWRLSKITGVETKQKELVWIRGNGPAACRSGDQKLTGWIACFRGICGQDGQHHFIKTKKTCVMDRMARRPQTH